MTCNIKHLNLFRPVIAIAIVSEFPTHSLIIWIVMLVKKYMLFNFSRTSRNSLIVKIHNVATEKDVKFSLLIFQGLSKLSLELI